MSCENFVSQGSCEKDTNVKLPPRSLYLGICSEGTLGRILPSFRARGAPKSEGSTKNNIKHARLGVIQFLEGFFCSVSDLTFWLPATTPALDIDLQTKRESVHSRLYHSVEETLLVADFILELFRKHYKRKERIDPKDRERITSNQNGGIYQHFLGIFGPLLLGYLPFQ